MKELTERTGDDLLMIQEPYMPITGGSILPTHQAATLLCYIIPDIVMLGHMSVVIHPQLRKLRMLRPGDHTFDYVLPQCLSAE
jgi:hypothetical protein